MKPLISVIISVYNCENYINRLINSVLSQTYKNFEIIILNDGSTDNTLAILKQFNDSGLRIIDKKNTGVSDTRNQGIELVNGDFICFLDADDYLENNYFQEIDEILKKNPNIELINFGFYSDVENYKLEMISSDKINYIEKKYNSHQEIKDDFVNLWDNTMLYNIWNKVYRTKIIKEKNIKFPNYNWGEDVEFNRLYLNEIKELYNSNKAFYHYVREREGAVTKKYKSQLFEIRKKEFREFNDYFDLWDISKTEYYEFSCRRFIERLLGCIENVYCSNLNFRDRYSEIKSFITDPITREALKYAKPKSKKIMIMLIPIKFKSKILTMIMGKFFHLVKTKFPSIFNQLKNRR